MSDRINNSLVQSPEKAKCPQCNSEFTIYIDDYTFRCIDCRVTWKIIGKHYAEKDGKECFVRFIVPTGRNARANDVQDPHVKPDNERN